MAETKADLEIKNNDLEAQKEALEQQKNELLAQKEALEAQQNKLLAEHEAMKAQLVEVKAENGIATGDDPNQMVYVKLPIIPGEPRDKFVCVNGRKPIKIQRGHRVKVPLYIKEVLDNAEAQLELAEDMENKLESDYEAQLEKMR